MKYLSLKSFTITSMMDEYSIYLMDFLYSRSSHTFLVNYWLEQCCYKLKLLKMKKGPLYLLSVLKQQLLFVCRDSDFQGNFSGTTTIIQLIQLKVFLGGFELLTSNATVSISFLLVGSFLEENFILGKQDKKVKYLGAFVEVMYTKT